MKTDLRVAVCTNRSPDAALEALRDQVPPEALSVVVSGREDPAHLSEPRPGLSHARNRALEWAAGAGTDVLAFIDDDALVDPGWYDALRARWDEAPADLACIGGPNPPRHALPPPARVSHRLAPLLTLVDRRPPGRGLHPPAEAGFRAPNSLPPGP